MESIADEEYKTYQDNQRSVVDVRVGLKTIRNIVIHLFIQS